MLNIANSIDIYMLYHWYINIKHYLCITKSINKYKDNGK